ncbi:MAG: hypothetical protein ACKVIN_08745 [Longimicrobiales bacterium]|jgi:hypothetical protein
MSPTHEAKGIAESPPLTEIDPRAPSTWGPACTRRLVQKSAADALGSLGGVASRTVAGSPSEEFASTRLVRLRADATALTSILPEV